MATASARSAADYELKLAFPLALFFLAFFVAPLLMLIAVSFYADPGMTRFGTNEYTKFVTDDYSLTVQRDPDQAVSVNDPVPFGLAVTLTMPGVVEIYEQVRQRLAITPRAAI